MPDSPRLARYRNVYTIVIDAPADPDFWTVSDGIDADEPIFPRAADLLVTLEDLAVLVETDPTLDDAAAATLAADIRRTWAALSDTYDDRTDRLDLGSRP